MERTIFHFIEGDYQLYKQGKSFVPRPCYHRRRVDKKTVVKLLGGKEELKKKERYCHLDTGFLGTTVYGGWIFKRTSPSNTEEAWFQIVFLHLSQEGEMACADFFTALEAELLTGERKLDRRGSLLKAA